ncbi:MAG: D-aminoacyl-tRNA deacylase [Bacillota bacterium]
MRAVVQRVSKAKVSVNDHPVGSIDLGLVVFLGVGDGDGEEAARFLAEKVVHLRIFPDDLGKMNRSVVEIGGGILAVSQFTLYGDCRKGRRPNFTGAAPPERAEKLYDQFVECLRQYQISVATGVFQAMMSVEIHNDGPVTILLDSDRNF